MSKKMLLCLWMGLCACMEAKNDHATLPDAPPHTILLSPAHIKFTQTPSGTKQTKTLTIINATSDPLIIEGLELRGDDELGFGKLPDVDPILKQAELLNIEIIWTPTDNIPDEATITIITNDPQNPTLEVPVTTP